MTSARTVTPVAPVHKKNIPWVLIGILIFTSFLFFFRLGERSFRNPDEGRYAQIAHEMVDSGDWVKPTLFGLGYLRKPILIYWLVAASFKAFGFHEWAGRFAPALFGVLGVWAVYWFTSRYVDKKVAALAALILATNFWYLQVGRFLVIDSVFAFFVTVALFAFYGAMRSAGKKFHWALIIGAALALAFLAKGYIALAIFAVSTGVYMLYTGSLFRVIRGMYWIPSLVVFYLIASPWYVAIEKRDPGFLSFFFWHENLKRFISSDFEHQQPWYYYLMILPPILLPWILFIRPTRMTFLNWRAKAKEDPRFFLVVSIAATIVFFSMSRSKLPTYILSCLPLCAILIAYGWRQWMDSHPRLGRLEYAALFFVFVMSIVGIAGGPWYVAKHLNKFPREVAFNVQLLGCSLLVGGILCLRAIREGRVVKLFMSFVVTMAAFCICFILMMETMNALYTTKHLAMPFRSHVQKEHDVFVFDHPGPFYDFSFYLDHPVKLVGLEGELEYSRDDSNAPNISITKEDFFARLERGDKLYCIMRKSDFNGMPNALRERVHILRQDTRKVLFSSGGLS